MTSVQPVGEPPSADGSLPPLALARHGEIPLSLYVHVPFCRSRCGYCDFNTYTINQLSGYKVSDYLASVHQEISLARRILPDVGALASVFFGGGTPSVLTGAQLSEIMDDISSTFGLVNAAEVTSEANPESVDAKWCEQVVASGVNRLSLGMQSAKAEVLAVLDRVHTPRRALQVAELARRAGFKQISLDLIYGTPGESLDDWSASLEAALSVHPDHLSAYSLIVESGTALARKISRKELPVPDDDDLADKYLLAEKLLVNYGMANYEISNWSTSSATRSTHNLAYWRGFNWWGIGPGAHSHIGGVRWWNHKLPRDWSAKLAGHLSPAKAREVLDAEQRRVERVLLELRLADGLPLDVLKDQEKSRIPELLSDELIKVTDNRIRLTVSGRLLADAVTRTVLD